MKIKFNSDDDLRLKKTLELHNIQKIIRSVFHDVNKYYPCYQGYSQYKGSRD